MGASWVAGPGVVVLSATTAGSLLEGRTLRETWLVCKLIVVSLTVTAGDGMLPHLVNWHAARIVLIIAFSEHQLGGNVVSTTRVWTRGSG